VQGLLLLARTSFAALTSFPARLPRRVFLGVSTMLAAAFVAAVALAVVVELVVSAVVVELVASAVMVAAVVVVVVAVAAIAVAGASVFRRPTS
jgi:uncharacterized membrane protein YhaH (DUF805 family)